MVSDEVLCQWIVTAVEYCMISGGSLSQWIVTAVEYCMISDGSLSQWIVTAVEYCMISDGSLSQWIVIAADYCMISDGSLSKWIVTAVEYCMISDGSLSKWIVTAVEYCMISDGSLSKWLVTAVEYCMISNIMLSQWIATYVNQYSTKTSGCRVIKFSEDSTNQHVPPFHTRVRRKYLFSIADFIILFVCLWKPSVTADVTLLVIIYCAITGERNSRVSGFMHTSYKLFISCQSNFLCLWRFFSNSWKVSLCVLLMACCLVTCFVGHLRLLQIKKVTKFLGF